MAEPRAPTETDAGNPAFLGWDPGGELAAALDACANVYFPPRPFSVLRVAQGQRVQGHGQGQALQLRHRSPSRVPGFTPPYAIAVVELDEGSADDEHIVDCPQTPEALELDMKLEVAFEKLDDKITLPLFRPAKG